MEAADALLVAGSSLSVMSGLRFVRHAARLGLPVVILNRGATRGDDLATVKVDAGCTDWLSAWADRRDAQRAAARSGQRDEDVLGGLEVDLGRLA